MGEFAERREAGGVASSLLKYSSFEVPPPIFIGDFTRVINWKRVFQQAARLVLTPTMSPQRSYPQGMPCTVRRPFQFLRAAGAGAFWLSRKPLFPFPVTSPSPDRQGIALLLSLGGLRLFAKSLLEQSPEPRGDRVWGSASTRPIGGTPDDLHKRGTPNRGLQPNSQVKSEPESAARCSGAVGSGQGCGWKPREAHGTRGAF